VTVQGKKIGIFDSGVGGLTVARAVLQALPGARILYFADTAYAPYGDRPLDQISQFVEAILRFLEGEGVDAIVAGCNISWALLLSGKVQAPSVPVFELLTPGAQAAAAATGNGIVGVLATTRTVESGAYPKAIEARRPGVRVVQQACPALVPLVERGELDSPAARQAVAECVRPLRKAGADTMVLGCTHYPFLTPLIAAEAGPGVWLVDPADEAARRLRQRDRLGVGGGEPVDGRAHRFYASGATDLLRRYVTDVLAVEEPTMAQLDVHPDVG